MKWECKEKRERGREEGEGKANNGRLLDQSPIKVLCQTLSGPSRRTWTRWLHFHGAHWTPKTDGSNEKKKTRLPFLSDDFELRGHKINNIRHRNEYPMLKEYCRTKGKSTLFNISKESRQGLNKILLNHIPGHQETGSLGCIYRDYL